MKWLGALLLVIAFAAIVYFYSVHKTRIVSAHVINMEKSKDRYEDFQQKARAAGLDVERWAGVDGATLSKEECLAEGVPEPEYTQHKGNSKMGKIGCWIAHKNLLKKLLDTPASPTDVHLIFEDDAIVPADFFVRWNTLLHDLPANWDVVQLGCSQPKTRKLYKCIYAPNPGWGNYGTFAYAVRHGAVKKIYDSVKIMNGPIDVMYCAKNQQWRWYIVQPELIPHDYGYYSNTENKRYTNAPPK
jgi:GR25 family glycosyltransferase involved in LPS biosynthesis